MDPVPDDDEPQHDPLPVSSLRSICLHTCERNANRITDVGDVPYDLIESVLLMMAPATLLQVEANSPQIRADSDKVWKRLVQRNFSSEERLAYPMPPNMGIRDYCRRLLKKRSSKLQKTSQEVRAQYDKIEREKAKNKIVQLDIYEDPQEQLKRKRKAQKEASQYKKLSIVKKARIESRMNPIFSATQKSIASPSRSFSPSSKSSVSLLSSSAPLSSEEADRLRKEKLRLRLANSATSARSLQSMPAERDFEDCDMSAARKSQATAPRSTFFSTLSRPKTSGSSSAIKSQDTAFRSTLTAPILRSPRSPIDASSGSSVTSPLPPPKKRGAPSPIRLGGRKPVASASVFLPKSFTKRS
ncbi:RNA polymerase II transcription factor SIII subunit A-domain-containing protein [Limtongia smithiae]|uniref:RNA polymerase II transcription factor SIII subunit A-domain-containing protein n=1 Tax=Limtongia smithiae TaxID=1125753 RepID=UPI0034CE3ED1